MESGSHIVPPTLPVSNTIQQALPQLGVLDAGAVPNADDQPVRVLVAMYAFERLLDLRHFQDDESLDDYDVDGLMMGDASCDSELEEERTPVHRARGALLGPSRVHRRDGSGGADGHARL